ncbi:MAG: tRNA (N6-isopentenyl adenosine(37)-C2)-methylthiotransferase MiaB [Pseudobdellovibrionaceae bacterium]
MADKSLYIKTWGCQMNVYDSHRIADVLKPLGYALSDTPEGADMMVLNTCHIREKATEKVFSELGRLRDHKQSHEEATGRKVLIAVAGCVAQAEGDIITQRAPYVDLVFGPQTYHRLPEMVANLTGARRPKRLIDTDFPVEGKFDHLPEETTPQGASAFLSIQEGCDKFCTFCVVPYTRGAEYSRNLPEIVAEARRLVDGGAKDINLLGQNVNAWHGTDGNGKTVNLTALLNALHEIDGLERLRYTTSHPKDMDQELIDAHGNLSKLMPFLHLPIQSGSDKILDAMNRKHDGAFYIDIIDRLRKARPDIAFSSDIIVGFPGETEEDFMDTMRMVERVGYASCYSFKYSPRPGTPAAGMKAALVREDIKSDRLTRVQDLLMSQQKAFNETYIGKTMPVLFDRKGRDGQIHGRSPYFQAVHVEANERLIGNILDVKIEGATLNSLTGTIVTDEHTSSRSAAA